jgi:hypothetical protein
MGFIEKTDPVVLNIKLTSIGREQLAKGKLTFNSFAIGDSEINYIFNNQTGFDPFLSNIMRPLDKNPRQLSFIPRNASGSSYNSLGVVGSVPSLIQNVTKPSGFFITTTGDTSTILTDPNHVKQPDAMVKISGVTGGTKLSLFQSPSYQAYVAEPSVGDFLLVRWTNPNGDNTTGFTINSHYPKPFLFYKIQSIQSGSLAANNLVITVDRNLPDFEGFGGNIEAGALVYRNQITVSGDPCYSTDSIAASSLYSFFENCQSPIIEYPFWNMSIIFTDEIAGVKTTNIPFGDLPTNAYAGFVSYIQNQAPIIKKMGLIHYTNPSPANTYGESLYLNTPVLYMPTVMWHKKSVATMGIVLRAYGSQKLLTSTTSHSLNTPYYNLADQDNNIVGKVFIDLQLFTIEDQELIMAMSYKSNRSWTLPQANVGINDNVSTGCIPDAFVVDYVSGLTTTIGGNDGGFAILIGAYTGPVFITISQISGVSTTISYTGTTTIPMIIRGFGVGLYNIGLYDAGGGGNYFSTVEIIDSSLGFYDIMFTETLTP